MRNAEARTRFEQSCILYDQQQPAHWGTFAMVLVSLLYSAGFVYLVAIHLLHPSAAPPAWMNNVFFNAITWIVTMGMCMVLMATKLVPHGHLWASVYLVNSAAAFILLSAIQIHQLATGIVLASVIRVLVGAIINWRMDKR